jgi:hypothetical protein
MKLSVSTKHVTKYTEFLFRNGSMVIYQMYFQKMEDGNFIPRVITPQTNMDWLKKQIIIGRIYLPETIIIAENN